MLWRPCTHVRRTPPPPGTDASVGDDTAGHSDAMRLPQRNHIPPMPWMSQWGQGQNIGLCWSFMTIPLSPHMVSWWCMSCPLMANPEYLRRLWMAPPKWSPPLKDLAFSSHHQKHRKAFQPASKMTVTRGDEHEFLRMQIVFNMSKGTVAISIASVRVYFLSLLVGLRLTDIRLSLC